MVKLMKDVSAHASIPVLIGKLLLYLIDFGEIVFFNRKVRKGGARCSRIYYFGCWFQTHNMGNRQRDVVLKS